MIPLPQLNITRDEYQECAFFEQIKVHLKKKDLERGEGIHASDLIDPKLAYWQNVLPKETTERQAYFFIIGQVLHTLVLQLADPLAQKGATDSGPKVALGILFSPDLEQDGRPAELKTSRANFEPSPEKLQSEFSHYLEQLAIYQILMNSLTGYLWVLFISLKDSTNRTFPEIRIYKLVLTEAQFFELEKEITAVRDRLADAILKKDPTHLPLCRAWRCGESCGWWNDCRPAPRWPEKDKRRWKA